MSNYQDDEELEQEEESAHTFEIKNYIDYKASLNNGVLLTGNGFSATYNDVFLQYKFPIPNLAWRKSVMFYIIDFLMDEHNIDQENKWRDFHKQLHTLFRKSFINPILSAHINLYDKNKIKQL